MLHKVSLPTGSFHSLPKAKDEEVLLNDSSTQDEEVLLNDSSTQDEEVLLNDSSTGMRVLSLLDASFQNHHNDRK